MESRQHSNIFYLFMPSRRTRLHFSLSKKYICFSSLYNFAEDLVMVLCGATAPRVPLAPLRFNNLPRYIVRHIIEMVGQQHPLASLIVEQKLNIIMYRNLGMPHFDDYADLAALRDLVIPDYRYFGVGRTGQYPSNQNDIHWTFTTPFDTGMPWWVLRESSGDPGFYNVEMSMGGEQQYAFYLIEDHEQDALCELFFTCERCGEVAWNRR
jgi:hypothetical protein